MVCLYKHRKSFSPTNLVSFTVMYPLCTHRLALCIIVDVCQISDYEAVHPLRHWKDLKHRVSSHRRCFIFTHQAMPREPLMVLHTALTTEPSSNIQVSNYNYRNM